MFGFGNIRSGISEQEFITEYNRFSYRAILAGTTLGLLFFNGFAIYDYYFQPRNFGEHTLIRLGLVTPICIGVMIFLQSPKNREYTRHAVLFGSLVLALCTVYFYESNFHAFQNAPPVGLVFMIMYTLTSMRLLRREAIIFVAATMSATAYMLSRNNADAMSCFSYFFYTGVASALGLGVCHTIEQSLRKMVQQKKIAERQEAAATKLLESIFPISVANRLRKSSDAIAERCDLASILFADIQGFTAISGNLPPDKLVHDLDVIFSRIDDLCHQYGCEKIKTIGDSYMAVTGVPTPTEDHAVRIVNFALAMQSLSRELTLGGQPVTFRIGIHSGPVVAGVIGKSRFAYDLWGDSVNMASRMESIAPPGMIQISSDTAHLVKDFFSLQCRGKIQVKGKGDVEAWLVLGDASSRLTYYLDDNKKSA